MSDELASRSGFLHENAACMHGILSLPRRMTPHMPVAFADPLPIKLSPW